MSKKCSVYLSYLLLALTVCLLLMPVCRNANAQVSTGDSNANGVETATGSALVYEYPSVELDNDDTTDTATGSALTSDSVETGEALTTATYDLKVSDKINISYDSEYIYVGIRYRVSFDLGDCSYLEVRILEDACLFNDNGTVYLTPDEYSHIWDSESEGIRIADDGTMTGIGYFELKAPIECGIWMTDINIIAEVIE